MPSAGTTTRVAISRPEGWGVVSGLAAGDTDGSCDAGRRRRVGRLRGGDLGRRLDDLGRRHDGRAGGRRIGVRQEARGDQHDAERGEQRRDDPGGERVEQRGHGARIVDEAPRILPRASRTGTLAGMGGKTAIGGGLVAGLLTGAIVVGAVVLLAPGPGRAGSGRLARARRRGQRLPLRVPVRVAIGLGRVVAGRLGVARCVRGPGCRVRDRRAGAAARRPAAGRRGDRPLEPARQAGVGQLHGQLVPAVPRRAADHERLRRALRGHRPRRPGDRRARGRGGRRRVHPRAQRDVSRRPRRRRRPRSPTGAPSRSPSTTGSMRRASSGTARWAASGRT